MHFKLSWHYFNNIEKMVRKKHRVQLDFQLAGFVKKDKPGLDFHS